MSTLSTTNLKNPSSGSNNIVLDSSGRVLVGTSTSDSNFNSGVQIAGIGGSNAGSQSISRFSADATSPSLWFQKSRGASIGTNTIVNNGDDLGLIGFYGANGSTVNEAARITAQVDGTPGASSDMPGRLVFSTTADGAASPTERMRITSGGEILISATAFGGTGISISSPEWSGCYATSVGTTSRNIWRFANANGVIGNITTSGSATTYNTSSDYRLKENVTPVADCITRLQQLKPSRFNFIADPDHTVDGFIAHEAQAVVPECVTGEKDAVDEDGNPVYQGIDQSKLVPLLTAALQEAIAKIESLETRLSALEAV